MKSKALISGALMTLCLSALLSCNALAAECDIPGPASAEFYPGTDYAAVYGAEYNYGRMNITDFQDVPCPYGCSDGTAIGAAERIVLPGVAAQSGTYGVLTADNYVCVSVPSSVSVPTSVTVSPAVNDTAVTPYILQPTAYSSVQGMERADGSIGTVKIPTLGIDMKVWEGETSASMAKGLGHYSSSSGWDGNVCVCGHNRGARYVIGSIKDLKIGDSITYTTVYGTRTYAVSYVGTISVTDWSRLQATADNRITLTTCLANQPDYRVCVQAVEIS